MIWKSKAPFFHYNQLTIHVHPQVYEPAEDTFFLLDSVNIGKKDTVFEIGTGTGIIALSCAQKGASVICSDINPYAVRLAQKNVKENIHLLKGSIQIRQGTLFSVLKPDEYFDTIIFNPPYLPTTTDEQRKSDLWFNAAVDGGKTGLDITNGFLKNISKHLKPKGKGYFIFSTLSERILLGRYLESYHLHDKIISSLSFENETLEIHEITL